MTPDAIEPLLRDLIGLSVETVGPTLVRNAVRRRMQACGSPDEWDYARRLAVSADEVQALVDEVVVPETWFFRDRDAFTAMRAHLAAHLPAGGMIRIASVPCSTGEEAYSIAMEMLDAGHGPDDFVVDAIDVSRRSLAAAEHAVYGRNAFRGDDTGFRDRHFATVEGGWRPNVDIRRPVRLRHGNLLDPTSIGPGPWHAIFCRNVLIYLEADTQMRVLDTLRAVLVPGGLLLVGPSEARLPFLTGFRPVGIPRSSAFLRPQGTEPAPRTARPMRDAGSREGDARSAGALPAPVPVRREAAAESLARIRSAADRGLVAEARSNADAHLQSYGPSAEAYYLVGLVADASGETDDAIRNYRRAIYLESDHGPALAQLALALQREGQGAAARALRERLDRLRKRSG